MPGESSGWRCWGSSHGWLAMVDLLAGTFVFNPISDARVDLPHIRELAKREQDPVHMAWRKPRPLTRHELQTVPMKLVLSSSPLEPDCIAMAILRENRTLERTLVYVRPGAESWVHLPTPFVWYDDVVYHGGRFYAVSCMGDIVAINFCCGGGAPRPAVELFAPEPFVAGKVLRRSPLHYRMCLVVLPSEDFLLVVDLPDFYQDPKPTDSNIFKLVCNNQEKKWVKQDSIGDCSLFLGLNQSLSLPASVAVGRFKPNCIYFSGVGEDSYIQNWFGAGDFRIYNVADRKIEFFRSTDSVWIMSSPLWITPCRR